MKRITVCETEADKIEDLCTQHETSEAVLVWAILEAIEHEGIDLAEYI